MTGIPRFRKLLFVRLIAAAALVIGFAPALRADVVTASWNFNAEPDVATYLLSYGTQPGVYTTTIDCGNVSTQQVTLAAGSVYYFAVRAKNTQGGISAYSAEVSVNLSNQAPTLSPVASQTSLENTNTALQLVATDPDGSSLTYSASGLPPEASLNTSSGLITGRLTALSAGTHSVTATVTDGTASSQQTFMWSVVNRAPEVTIANDFDGDLKSDVAVDRTSGVWSILRSGTNNLTSYEVPWGSAADLPVPGDYDGDGRTDIAFYRPTNGTWNVLKSTGDFVSSQTFTLGTSADRPAPGDYDGDGRTDPSVFHPGSGSWDILRSSTNFTSTTTVVHGASGDVPVPGDYDGDAKTDVAIFRPSSGLWSIVLSSTNSVTNVTWGVANDLPVPGDYDGDSRTDIAVYRPSTGEWRILKSSTNFTASQIVLLGLSRDRPVPGDYEGDGRTDVATYRPSTGEWTIHTSSSNYSTTLSATLGGVADRPVPNAIVANNIVGPSDSFVNRIPLAGDTATSTASSVGATAEGGEPSDSIGAGSGTPSMWWAWTAPCTFTVTQPTAFVDTIGSGFNTVLGVFTGSGLGALTLFASDDNSGGGNTSRVPSLSPGPSSLSVAAGTAFQIRVRGSAATDAGPVTLHITSPCTSPTISTIPLQTTTEDTATGAIAFTVADSDTPLGSLIVSGSSSNTTLVPNANIAFGGSGANRTVTITPAANQSGQATITVTVSDGTAATTMTFLQVVTAVDDAPTITAIADQAVDQNTSTPLLAFTVGDVETAAASLVVTASSSNTTLVPQANIQLGGSGASRQVLLTPAPNMIGTTKITLTLNDGGIATSRQFYVSVRRTGQTQAPVGAFDTPAEGAAVQGSIAVTGWALDDVGITRVEIWRDLAPSETTVPFNAPGHPAHGKVFIANAAFLTGARPDIEAALSDYPFAYRAGWGYLLLTQGLWNQGNGSYTLYALAYDESRIVTLGRKTITVGNANATKPFGALDTPGLGEIVSSPFWSFGWALTPGPNAADARTCTITNGNVFVGIDSQALVAVDYGGARADIAGIFPGFANSSNAGGAFYIDTTTLSDGAHQIGWFVIDDCGRAEGVGSRFFTVQKGSSMTAAEAAPSVADDSSPATEANAVVQDVSPAAQAGVVVRDVGPAAQAGIVAVRHTGGEWTEVPRTASGAYVLAVDQGDRIEVRLAPGMGAPYVGALRLPGGEMRALPLGSTLDAAQGLFYWQPAAGFLGNFELEFWNPANLATASNVANASNLVNPPNLLNPSNLVIRVRIVVGPPLRVAIDTPSADLSAAQPFVVAGWALDLTAADGSGIDAVHVWAYPTTGRDPTFVGGAAIGDERPDVAAIYGEAFMRASYSLIAKALAPGTYDLVVYPHRAATGAFEGAQATRVTVR